MNVQNALEQLKIKEKSIQELERKKEISHKELVQLEQQYSTMKYY